MKKSEFKVLIKQCIQELILEEGFLIPIITEIAKGHVGDNVLVAEQAKKENKVKVQKPQHNAARKRLLDNIGKNSLNGVDVFSDVGSRTLSEGKSDPGIDISQIPGLSISNEIFKKMKGA